MIKKTAIAIVLIVVFILSGCASVPMAPTEQDIAAKEFTKPTGDMAGLYVFRDTFVGQALKKTVSLDGTVIGETANKVFFYREITPGGHTLSTESEFSDNLINFQAEKENNYFAEQYIKIGVFVGGANVRMVSEEDGKKGVLGCHLAK
jgi:protein involved in sex pheromone biosynthesis